MFNPPFRVGACGGEDKPKKVDASDLDDRTRFQYLAVLQFLQAKGLIESCVALESETGVSYTERSLPTAAVLEASLDMFSNYSENDRRGRGKEDTHEAREFAAAQAELLRLECGVCCTGSRDGEAALSMNVTAVCWAATRFDEMLALAATADKKLRLLGSDGEVLAQISDFSSPLLGLDVAPGDAYADQEVVATAMGGEVTVLKLKRSEEGSFTLEVAQRFKDHAKHATSVRFSPLPAGGEESEGSAKSQYFVTVSRDHTARLYRRGAGGEFGPAGVVRLPAEVTCCCWVNADTFVLAAREDHHLLYYDAAECGTGVAGAKEKLKTNMNALGDSVVSFAVLALAMSPNGKMLAACTDKSRVIVLQPFTGRQLRNLYGAVVEEYDSPSICFSLDSTFVYATTHLPQARKRGEDGEEGEELVSGFCGQVAVFEVCSGELVLQLPFHTRAVRCMQRHPHTEALVTGSFDKSVVYWG